MKKICILISLVFVSVSCSKKKILKPSHIDFSDMSNRFIAHAGGAIEGMLYTNSLQALNNAIKDGKRLIEFDLIETNDGHLVAAHDWKYFKSICGFPSETLNHKPLSLEEFSECKIFGKFDPISLSEISTIFEKHKNLVLVTDKTNNFKLLKKQFVHHDRLIVEIFSRKSYMEAVAEGGFIPALSTKLKKKDLEFIWHENVQYLITGIGSLKNKKKLEILIDLKKHGREVFVYTASNDLFIKKFNDIVSAFYTDFWSLTNQKCMSKNPENCKKQL